MIKEQEWNVGEHRPEEGVSRRDRRGCQGKAKSSASADGMQTSLQRHPAQDSSTLIIYLKNITAFKGQEGFMVLELVCIGVVKSLRDFMVQCFWVFLEKETCAKSQ